MPDSRKKGAAGEREIINLLKIALPNHTFSRNLSQYQRSGYDILTSIPWLAIEVKRCETLHIAKWLEQAKRQAKPGQIPVLAYRKNLKPWVFIVDNVELDFNGFIFWIKRKEDEKKKQA